MSEGKEQIPSFLNKRVYSKTSEVRDTILKNKGIDFSNGYIQQLLCGQKANQIEKMNWYQFSILLKKAIWLI